MGKAISFEELISLAGNKKKDVVSDEKAKLDIARELGVQHKADEVLSTINNTNWTDSYGMQNDIKDLTPMYGNLLPLLSEGYEGNNLPDSYPVPYDITDYFMKGKSEWEDTAKPSFDNQTITDSKSTLTQKSLILEFGISDEAIAAATDRQLYNKLLAKLAKSYTRTIESMIINGDSETGATGNVNSDDQAPATTFGSAAYHSLLLDHGIREAAINNSKTYDVAAFDSDDMMTVLSKLASRYQGRLSDLLWIFEPKTYTVAKVDDGFKLASSRSVMTSVDNGVIEKPWGIDLIQTDLVPLTEADGKVSATPSNNVKGQFLIALKNAIRWGQGIDFKIEAERVAGYGVHLVATVKAGFVILDYTNTCAAGINVTV